MQEQITELFNQVQDLQVRLDGQMGSSDISRDNETALRERLGLNTNNQAFPVGGLFFSTVSTDPNTLLGYGTWSAFGAGNVMVGYNSGDPDFGTLGATGGEKTHVLTVPEMPAHTHNVPAHAFVGTVTDFTATTGNTPTQVASSSTGGGGAHNNLQPFIVVKIWLRTA